MHLSLEVYLDFQNEEGCLQNYCTQSLLKKISHFVNQTQTQVTVKDVQLFFKNLTGVQIPSYIIIKILKQKLNYVWKWTSLRVIDLDFERNEQLKVLYSVKFSKWLSDLSLLVNVDGSSFSKETHICHS